jgi:hypothetical protein
MLLISRQQNPYLYIKKYFSLFLFLGVGLITNAQTKQLALIIGINEYKPSLNEMAADSRRSWTNLDGCVNDANAMRDLVVSKYAFKTEHITTLFNSDASRERIIAALEKLVTNAKKGDVVFIYYAGHGSQVKNSLSIEADKKDETIVPADAWKKGVSDIRDKELAKYFNLLLDKGVLLTVIMDSCHSGSGSRGDNFLYEPPKARYIEEANYDAKDATMPQRPEERGALIMAAAQDFEFAKEHKDENNIPHGAFTSALLKAAQQLSVDASANDLYVSLAAIMKYYGKTQEPSIAGNAARKEGTLFALPKGTLQNNFFVPSSRPEAKGIELQGGLAFGIREGVKLANGKDTLQVIEMRGANKSLAKVLTGAKEKIAPGTMFQVVNWASSKAPALKVFIPSGVTTSTLQTFTNAYKTARSAKKINWVNDIARNNPDKIYSYVKGQWYVNDKKAGREQLESFTASSLQTSLGSAGSAFVNMPPSTDLREALTKQFSNYNNISMVEDPTESMYSLVGVMKGENIEYALIKTQVTVTDSTESLPAVTDFVSEANVTASAATLSEYAFRIAKIKDWLMLEGPKGTNKFPFKLGFQGYTSGAVLHTDQVKVGDTLSIYFEEDKKEGGWKSNYSKRYIYVFSIDSKGNTNLLFPSIESGNVENRFPITNAENALNEPRTHIADIVVVPPMGADNYFMLSTEQAIGNLSVFQQEGVLTRSVADKGRGDYNPLEDLLFTGTKTRNNTLLTPVTWSIHKVILRTKN